MSESKMLTPPEGWAFAWLDELAIGTSFRYAGNIRIQSAPAAKDTAHTLVLVPLDAVEVFRRALMKAHADDWDMDTISEAAHICAQAMRLVASTGTETDNV